MDEIELTGGGLPGRRHDAPLAGTPWFGRCGLECAQDWHDFFRDRAPAEEPSVAGAMFSLILFFTGVTPMNALADFAERIEGTGPSANDNCNQPKPDESKGEAAACAK